MATQIPIKLTPLPAPQSVQWANFDQMVVLICKYIAAAIGANVSFFIQGPSAPSSDQGLFYNTTVNKFMRWSPNDGKYIYITDFVVGMWSVSSVAGDDAAGGWIMLDGRAIDSIGGITPQQQNVLNTIFGANQNLPNVTFAPAIGTPPFWRIYVGGQ
jgi:hypothetical protein